MEPSFQQPFVLCSILYMEKLNGPNYRDSVRNLRIVLREDKREHVLDTPVPDEQFGNGSDAMRNAYNIELDDSIKVSYVMLGAMEPKL